MLDCDVKMLHPKMITKFENNFGMKHIFNTIYIFIYIYIA